MSRKIILIDGNSLFYRAFYALPTSLSLKSGQVTNAVYGFTSMLIRLLTDERPDVVAVAFDTREPTWRHKYFKEYKANRDATPDELISQMPLVKEVLTALAIPIFELPGHEADDILATLAVKSEANGDEVLVVTADKDALQLITDSGVKVMTTRKGITDIVIYDRDKVRERYGVTPEQIPDFLGLKGDASDNIPGVPGVGDKTAAKLLQQFGSVEEIYEGVADIKGDRLRRTLEENREQAEMSKTLAVLTKDLPLELDAEDQRLGRWDPQVVREVFSQLEFKTLLERFETQLAGAEDSTPDLQVNAITVEDLGSFLVEHKDAPTAGVAIVRDDAKHPIGLAIAFGDISNFTVGTIMPAPDGAPFTQEFIEPLRNWLTHSKTTVCLHDLKDQPSAVKNLGATFFDLLLAAYLLDPAQSNYDPAELGRTYLNVSLSFDGSPVDNAARAAVMALVLKEPLATALETENLSDVYKNIELPLVPVLSRMEETGVGLDRSKLSTLSSRINDDLETTADRIYKLAGEEFNINSPRQVSRILFDKLGLRPVRKTKSGGAYATDALVLAKLAGDHEIVPLVLNHRELSKLKSTYIMALPKLLDATTGRLHTSFNQAATATGRLSSSNPNLQNIPTRTELGRKIREAFVPAHRDEKLLSADYSQIELRLLAHFSNDTVLKQAFRDGVDIHSATAAEVFDVAHDKVSAEQRRHAKAINFGIVYGMSPYGLSQQLDISPEAAKAYIDLYFNRYPAVKDYIEKATKDAYRLGYVSTLTGRKRYMPELRSANHNQRSFGERAAVNAPLQGSAADIIKLAMIDIDSWLTESGLQTRMVLQVHDELIFEVPPLEEAIVKSEVGPRMENAYELSVPLEVNLAFGRNWGEAK